MGTRYIKDIDATPEQILAWGYDEDLYFEGEADADVLLLGKPKVLSVLLKLAADDACPKQLIAFDFLCDFARGSVLYRRQVETDALRECRRSDKLPQTGLIGEWSAYVDRLLRYSVWNGPMDQRTARTMAQDLLVGAGRIPRVKQTGQQPAGWWEFVRERPQSYPTHIYINPLSGAFRISLFKPCTPEELARQEKGA